MSTKVPSKSVFVGNIPYGLTEEQIVDIFNSAGKVLSFRLVYDRETGRPKGFGFAEYPDIDSAASAVRNLNDYEIMNRKLRVDFSNDSGDDDTSAQTSYQPPMPSNGFQLPPPTTQNNSSLPPLPVGVDLPPGLTCPDQISRTLNTLPQPQLLDVISQMKTLATTEPSKATELLRQAPQLSYAIFQALLLMGLVSAPDLAGIAESAAAAPAAPIPAPQQAYIPPPSSYPPGFPPPPPHMAGQLGGQISTPPVGGQGLYPPPPSAQAVPQPQQQPAQAQPNEEALIQQVLSMPQSLIDGLPPADRAAIMSLRAQFGR